MRSVRTIFLLIVFIVLVGVLLFIIKSRIVTEPQDSVEDLEIPIRQVSLLTATSIPTVTVTPSPTPIILFNLFSPLQSSSSSPILVSESDPKIADIVLSDSADENGFVPEKYRVEVPDGGTGKIYATVKIDNAYVGLVVSAELIYDEGKNKAGPIENKVEKEGNIMKAFMFKSIGGFWTDGTYTINIRLSTGDKKSITFKVVR